MMKIEYDFTQLSKAAKFLWKKNPIYQARGQTVASVNEAIRKDLMRFALDVKRNIKTGKDWRFLSTGGYTILVFQDDSGKGLIAEILVDASVGIEGEDHDFMMVDV